MISEKGFEFTWSRKKGFEFTWYLKKDLNLHDVRKMNRIYIVLEKGFGFT